jgi:serine/threonine protein kinase
MIGEGGMGAVYEAVDERLNARVALKESFAKELELKQQFEREARLLAGLRHPALPKVTDYFIEHDHAFLVMEYIEGDSLAELVTKKAPLPAQQVIAWADQVLDVLIYLHSTNRSIVHRDIKPHNLKVTSAGVVSLLDFGLAKVTRAVTPGDDDVRSVHGYTRCYSPIEQIEDSGTNARSDIYALGATLYHLLTAVRPEDSARRARAMATIGVDCLPRADMIVSAVGEDLARVIQRAMAVRNEQRYQTAEEFREALRRLGRVANTTVHAEARIAFPVVPAMKPRRKIAQLTVAAAVLILALTLAGQVLRKQTEVATPNVKNIAASDLNAFENLASRLTAPTPPKTKSVQINRPPSLAPIKRDGERDGRLVFKSREQNARVTRPLASPERQKIARSAGIKPLPKPKPFVTPTRDVDAPRVVRAPDGTEVVKYKDGRIRVFSGADRGGQR